MYWPSVQEDVSAASQVARGLVCAMPRMFSSRPALLDLKDLRCENIQSGSQMVMQPLRALLQPISDQLSRHVEMAAAAVFNPSTTTSPAAVSQRDTGVNGQHEKSACKR